MQEARELANDPSTEYSAAPLEVRSIAPLLSFMLTYILHVCSRTTFLCVFLRRSYRCHVSSAHFRQMWTSGVALHPAWACGHRLRGRIVPFSDPAASRIPIPASKHHAPHSQRQVRAKHQGERICLVFPIGYHALIRPFLDQICISFTNCEVFPLTKHTPFDSTFTQITRNCGNLHGECGPVRVTLGWNHASSSELNRFIL